MGDWLEDAAAGIGLIVFMATSFVMASMAQALLVSA